MAAPTSGLVARYFGPGSTYGASTSVADVAGGDFVDTESADGILAIPGADLSGKTSSTLSFTFQSTDTVAVVFSHGAANSPYFFVVNESNFTTSMGVGSGTLTVVVDGVTFTGGRDDLQALVCDGDPHDVVVSGIDFTASAGWVADGLYVGGYNSGSFPFAGTVSNLTLDGHAYTNGNRGTLNGGDNLSDLYVGDGNGPGGNLANHGVTLDGTADYVSATITGPGASQPWTFAIWVYDSAFDTNDCVFSWSTSLAFYPYDTVTGNGPRVYYNGNLLDINSGSPAVGTWHHFAVVNEASTGRLYVDGVEVGTFTPFRISGSQTLNVGRWSGASQNFSGEVADVIIYNRALSPSEIAQVYAEGVAAPATNPNGATIIGNSTVGSILICDLGTSSARASYQWNANGTAIAGATGASFNTSARSSGEIITCTVTTNSTESLTSGLILTSPKFNTRVLTGLSSFSTKAGKAPTPINDNWLSKRFR